jgi:outer membrane biosynthesis protein TonB
MSLNDSQLHGFAFAGTIVFVGSLFGTTVYLTQAVGATTHEPALKEMVAIEASLARKSEKKQQPQKVVKAPEPVAKPEGVSHDADRTPIEKKPDEPRKPPRPDDKPIDISRFKHATDDDAQTGTQPTTDIGQFNGSEKGFAPLNAGHPYWQDLNADFHRFWEIPQISKVAGEVVGCIHLAPDGKIAEIKMAARSGDQILDDSVERALKKTQAARNDKPQPVPTEELTQIRKMVCFRFDPNQ